MIRPATEADLQAILDIYNDAVINTTAVYSYTPHTLDMRRQWFNEHREAGLPIFVLEEDGVVAGFATYGNFRPWPAYKYCIEHSIYVHKGFRRRHIATRLMEKLLETANGAGYATMIAGIDADNAHVPGNWPRQGLQHPYARAIRIHACREDRQSGLQVRPLARSRFLSEDSRRPEGTCW